MLSELMARLKEEQATLPSRTGRGVPLAMTVVVHTTARQIPATVRRARDRGFAAVITAVESTTFGNTISRLCGDLCAYLGPLPLFSVGGIASAVDIWERLKAGAAWVRIYTGRVREGPVLAQPIVSGLRKRCPPEWEGVAA